MEMTPSQEVAMNLTSYAIEWLQTDKLVSPKLDGQKVGELVGNLYSSILEQVESAHNKANKE